MQDADAPAHTGFQYFSKTSWVNYGQWYLVRIIFNAQTGNLRFYLDGLPYDSWQPANAEELLKSRFFATVGVWTEYGTTITGYADDVRVGK